MAFDSLMISPSDSNKFCKLIGFTPYNFTPDSYITLKRRDVYISLIESNRPGRGHFRRMVSALIEQGLTVKIPTPIMMMKPIVIHLGFVKTIEYFEIHNTEQACEVWVRSEPLPEKKRGKNEK